jgi:hypothetical protein
MVQFEPPVSMAPGLITGSPGTLNTSFEQIEPTLPASGPLTLFSPPPPGRRCGADIKDSQIPVDIQ